MDTVTQIKHKLDIIDVVGAYIPLKKSGKNYKAPCPFHSEDSPSFMVSAELQRYKCFGCNEAGDMFNFVEKIESVDFTKALEILADKAGIEIQDRVSDPNAPKKKRILQINNLTAEFYSHLLIKHPIGKSCLTYLKDTRKLNDQAILEFRLGYAPDKWDLLLRYLFKKGFNSQEMLDAGVVVKRANSSGFIDKFRGRVVFPFIDLDGSVVGFTARDLIGRDPKYLNTEETLVFHKSSFLYGLNRAKVSVKKLGAVFVEGQLDVINSHQHDITHVIATSGTALTESQLKIVLRFTHTLILAFDSDTAGVNATLRAVELAEQLNFEVKIVPIPDGYKDLDELMKVNLAKAKELINNPVPVYDFYLVTVLKRYDKQTAYGKKKIVEELAPVFSKIKNTVVLDHYVKILAEEIGTSEDIIRELLKSGNVKSTQFKDTSNSIVVAKSINTPSVEEFFIAQILKADIDTMGSVLYKLERGDFETLQLREVFASLKSFLEGFKGKEFSIASFTDTLSQELKDVVTNLYLVETGEASKLPVDVEIAYIRVKADATKRALKSLSAEIKLAELEKNMELTIELTKKFKKLSESLL